MITNLVRAAVAHFVRTLNLPADFTGQIVLRVNMHGGNIGSFTLTVGKKDWS